MFFWQGIPYEEPLGGFLFLWSDKQPLPFGGFRRATVAFMAYAIERFCDSSGRLNAANRDCWWRSARLPLSLHHPDERFDRFVYLEMPCQNKKS